MKLIYSAFTRLLALTTVLIFLCNCSSGDDDAASDSNNTSSGKDLVVDAADLNTLIDDSSIGDPGDLESFLGKGKSSFPVNEVGAIDLDPSVSDGTDDRAFELDSMETVLGDKATDSSEQTTDNEILEVSNSTLPIERGAEKALSELEKSTVSHQRSIDQLRRINSNKDMTIASKDRTITSLTKLNKELVDEINRLKGESQVSPSIEIENSDSPVGKLVGLRAEVKNLRGNLLIKAKEIQDLRLRNDSLEGRISVLELSPSKKITSLPYTPDEKKIITPSIRPAEIATPAVVEIAEEARLFAGGCNLQFDAVVTALNGKNKEAFYTEFFIVDDDIENILRKGDISLEHGGKKIDSYSELWAQARKNSFLFPNVQKNIRSLLLKMVENGQGQRVRTDINGAATMENLPSGKFFVVGTASLGKVGVTWSVPVILRSGTNKLSLTLANANWSE